MQLSAADTVTLLIAVVLAATVTTTLLAAARSPLDASRRTWLAAGALSLVLITLGVLDVYTRTPREVALSTIVIAATIPVLGTVGMIRGTRRVRPWLRWLIVFVTAFLLLFASLLLGASYLSRMLGF